MYSTITPRLYVVGNALLGLTVTGEQISIVDQRDIIMAATLAELVAAKVIIQTYHATNMMALLLADCYLSAKSKQLRAA